MPSDLTLVLIAAPGSGASHRRCRYPGDARSPHGKLGEVAHVCGALAPSEAWEARIQTSASVSER